MFDFEKNAFRVFELFQKQWALIATGDLTACNACTLSWGSLGTLWTRPGKNGSVVTVYLYPTRYTRELLVKNDLFTVSFFPEEYKKALAYLGSHSGRDEDKISASGLTPFMLGGSVAFREASLTFVCRKLYQHQMSKEDLAEDVQAYYKSHPDVYPPDESGEWGPHWLFVGEIVQASGALG